MIIVGVVLMAAAAVFKRSFSSVIDPSALFTGTAMLLTGFALSIAAAILIESIWKSWGVADAGTGNIRLGPLWRSIETPCLNSLGIVAVGALGISSSASLADVYRISALQWNDALLWDLEGRLIHWILASPLNIPRFWDAIYNQIWTGMFLALAALSRSRCRSSLATAICAVVLAFHLTRYVSIAFPNAGPLFYRPEMFSIEGTLSRITADMLSRYMRGEYQDAIGLLPGTQAFPSLHVALAWGAMTLTSREWPWTLWLSIPWFALNWLSTVFLGWHYLVDGVGGIAVMMVSLRASQELIRLSDRLAGQSSLRGTH